MSLKIAYFQPIILAIDQVPPVEFSKMFNLAEMLHRKPELNDLNNPFINIKGGQQIQIYPNSIGIDVAWLIEYLEKVCRGYMELVIAQSGTEDLKLCKPVVTNIWTIQQQAGHYQEMHTHPRGNLSGNIYITIPDLDLENCSSDGQISFRLPQTKDVSKFIMNDTWKFTPTPSSIILFPSHLPHVVYPWVSGGYRTVISFDARLVPKDE